MGSVDAQVQKHSLVVCEGYQDRGFVGAWLERLADDAGLACTNLTDDSRRAIKRLKRTHAKRVGEREIYIVAAEGLPDVVPVAAAITKVHSASIDRVVLVVDADTVPIANRREAVLESFRTKSSQPVDVVVWEPQLELLIERALREATPARIAHIEQFLKSAPTPATTRKEASFTWCAAWEPDWFGDTFFQRVWDDATVRASLETQLAHEIPVMSRLLVA
jgi:hypothetical protein